jgi:hypothetical protein
MNHKATKLTVAVWALKIMRIQVADALLLNTAMSPDVPQKRVQLKSQNGMFIVRVPLLSSPIPFPNANGNRREMLSNILRSRTINTPARKGSRLRD